MQQTYINTSFGMTRITVYEGRVGEVNFVDFCYRENKVSHWVHQVDQVLLDSILDIIEGRVWIHNIPTIINGTDFQRAVLHEIKKIPPGKTISYKDLAINLGRPTAFRAVANACSNNQTAILIPCHRVIRQGGDPGGYFGGRTNKDKLLERENKI